MDQTRSKHNEKKHARKSGWVLHETWRQILFGPRSVWRNNAPKIPLFFFFCSCVPSEWSAWHRQCEAPFARIDDWDWLGSCKCMACKWDLPWSDLFADTNKYSVCGIRQPGFLFLRPSPWSILLCTSPRTSIGQLDLCSVWAFPG